MYLDQTQVGTAGKEPIKALKGHQSNVGKLTKVGGRGSKPPASRTLHPSLAASL